MPKIFVQTFTVPPESIDLNGHVNNLEYLRWMMDVATAHSSAHGWTMERYRETQTRWVVRSHHIDYLRPAFAGDTISLLTWISGIQDISSVRKYLVWRHESNQILAKAETLWVFVNGTTGRPGRIPDEFKTSFEVVGEDEDVLQAVRS